MRSERTELVFDQEKNNLIKMLTARALNKDGRDSIFTEGDNKKIEKNIRKAASELMLLALHHFSKIKEFKKDDQNYDALEKYIADLRKYIINDIFSKMDINGRTVTAEYWIAVLQESLTSTHDGITAAVIQSVFNDPKVTDHLQKTMAGISKDARTFLQILSNPELKPSWPDPLVPPIENTSQNDLKEALNIIRTWSNPNTRREWEQAKGGWEQLQINKIAGGHRLESNKPSQFFDTKKLEHLIFQKSKILRTFEESMPKEARKGSTSASSSTGVSPLPSSSSSAATSSASSAHPSPDVPLRSSTAELTSKLGTSSSRLIPVDPKVLSQKLADEKRKTMTPALYHAVYDKFEDARSQLEAFRQALDDKPSKEFLKKNPEEKKMFDDLHMSVFERREEESNRARARQPGSSAPATPASSPSTIGQTRNRK